MALRNKFKTKDEIPGEHLPLYAERERAWVFEVNGAVDQSRLSSGQTDKSQKVSIGSLNQESSATNAVPLIVAAPRAAVKP